MDKSTDSRLELRVEALRGPGRDQLRPVVDGRDVLATGFPRLPAHSARVLLGPYSPLLPGPVPREVQLARAGCSEECCGALYVTVRQEGGAVVWDGWRNPDLPGLDLPAYRFDAGRYLAEVERAGRGVESWPARSVGRLLEDALVRRPELLAAWQCELDAVWTGPGHPDRVDLVFWYPARPGDRGDEPWLQFLAELPLPAGEPEALAAALVERVATTDPRTWARVCGGSAPYAEALGRTWPEEL
ncbi:hypothetical protein [Kitasatospora cineracea]|uniref:hypothetical protein n=1 Tax=Kitasatospora cineracea TaxID=88074 RepID=UPI00367BE8B6